MFGKKSAVDPVKQLPQIGELFDEVKVLRNLISGLVEDEFKASEELSKLRIMFKSICPHKHTKLYNMGAPQWDDTVILLSYDTHNDQFRYGKKCNVCDHEEPMTKLEYLRAQKELIDSSIKENE